MTNNQPESYFEELNYAEAPQVAGELPGPRAKALLERQARVDSQVFSYPRMVPLAPAEGRGATVKDADGNVFIDLSSGVGVLNAGHSHPDVVAAIRDQADRMTHGLDFPGERRVEMSEKIASIAPCGLKNDCKVMLCGPTGTDAVEAAVKLARFNTARPTVIAFENSWHGVGGTGLAATGKRGVRQGFLPVMPEVCIVPYAYCYRCPFGKEYPGCDLQCAKFLEHVIADPDSGANDPGCVLIEPIQGEGGIIVPPDGYMQEVRRICDDNDVLMIVDEIQTGLGRSGTMYASERDGITPDIMTTSKTLGGGLPIAAIVMKTELDTWPAGAHVGTFRGNLLAAASGVAAINAIERDGLCDRSASLGAAALERLTEFAATTRHIGDVRGRGLFIGMEFVEDKESKTPAPEALQETVERCFEKGVLLWKAGARGNVGRMMPALVITERHLMTAIDVFEENYLEVERARA
jgi:diaminobutyrate-2-oxoglutarate transaminase